jgi:uncharacterized membrane protein YkoI
MQRTFLAALALLAVTASLAAPAHAWRRGGDDRGVSSANVAVSREQAVDIARREGLVRLHEVKFDDGVWEVEGWTANGDKIEFDIHPQTGAILKQEIYRGRR